MENQVDCGTGDVGFPHFWANYYFRNWVLIGYLSCPTYNLIHPRCLPLKPNRATKFPSNCNDISWCCALLTSSGMLFLCLSAWHSPFICQYVTSFWKISWPSHHLLPPSRKNWPLSFLPLRLRIDCFRRAYVGFFPHNVCFYIHISLLLSYYNSLRAGPFPFLSLDPNCPSKFEMYILPHIILRDFSQANKNIRSLRARSMTNSCLYYFTSSQ